MFVKKINDAIKADKYRRAEAMAACKTFWRGHGPGNPTTELQDIADYAKKIGVEADSYGIGKFLNGFEKEMATLFGYEDAVFLISGVMAQGIAMRLWAEKSGGLPVAWNATSHLEVNEEDGWRDLHGMKRVLLGEKHRFVSASDIESVPEKISAVLIELPQRRTAGILPSWAELEKIKTVCRSKNIKLHMDGARIWESQPFYGKSFSEITHGFDSMYVSFYKGIGGIAGSMLLGSSDFIAQARIWQRRMGGTLVQIYPYALSAKLGFEKRLSLFPKYRERSMELARALATLPGVKLMPETPHTSLFHLLIPQDPKKLEEAQYQIAAETGFWLGGEFHPTENPGWSLIEINSGDRTLEVPVEKVRSMFERAIRLSQNL